MKTPSVIALVTVVGVTCLFIGSHYDFAGSTRSGDVVMYSLQSHVVQQDTSVPAVSKDVFDFRNESVVSELRKKYGAVEYSGIKPRDVTLTSAEEETVKKCVASAKADLGRSNQQFWSVQHIRTKNHTYLKREDAVLLEVGGNQGDDASRFVDLYNPRYIIMEPLEQYANILKNKFKNNSRVTVVNLGLGAKTEVAFVKMDGNNACATSIFSSAGGETPLFVVNATEFLLKLGLGTFDIDLMTLNCEGCEFDALESVLSTTLVYHFRNIQFGTHSTIPVKDAIPRYCRIQALLARTHRPVYHYQLLWESWRRKDLP